MTLLQSPARNNVNILEQLSPVCLERAAPELILSPRAHILHQMLLTGNKNHMCQSLCVCGGGGILIMNKLILFTHKHFCSCTIKNKQKQPESVCPRGSEATNKSLVCLVKAESASWLRLVGGTGCRGLVVAAVHLLLHGAVLLQLLASVVGDLQEAAGLHHHVGLAGVRQDGVLRDHLHAFVTVRFHSVQFPVR